MSPQEPRPIDSPGKSGQDPLFWVRVVNPGNPSLKVPQQVEVLPVEGGVNLLNVETKRPPQPGEAMNSLIACLKSIGLSNERRGFDYITSDDAPVALYEKANQWARSFGSNAGWEGDRLRGDAEFALHKAFYNYKNAIEFMVGSDIPDDDLTLRVGFLNFTREYLPVGSKKRARKIKRLEKAIADKEAILPIETFYEEDNKIFATTQLGDESSKRSWGEISKDIGLSDSDPDPSNFPIFASVIDLVEPERAVRLTKNDQKITRVMTESSLSAAYKAVYKSKADKIMRDGQMDAIDEDGAREASRKAEEIELSTFRARLKRSENYINSLQGLSNIVQRLVLTISQPRGESYQLTTRDVEAITQKIIPDYAAFMLDEAGLDIDQRADFEEELTRAIFSPDTSLAESVAGQIGWYVDQRKSEVERLRASFSRVPRHIGRVSLR